MATVISNKLAVLISFIIFSSLVTGNAFAQSSNHTSSNSDDTDTTIPEIMIVTGFATFSYGLVAVTVSIDNHLPDIQKINIQVFDPDGKAVKESEESLTYKGAVNGHAFFSSYYFSIDREYIEENYKVVVNYGNYSETEAVPPFSSEYPQPPSVLLSASEQNDYGIYISGRVSGGIAGEQVNVAIYPEDGDSPLWSKTVGSSTKVIFDTSLPNSEAEALLSTGTYRVVATHLATDITGETMLNYMNPGSLDTAKPELTAEPKPLPAQTEPNESDDQGELIEDNDSKWTIRSPFIFEDENDNQIISASLPTVSNTVAQASIEDVLVINGTLASHYLVDNMTAQETTGMAQIYILSGNWSMTVNSTTVKDFAANFTVVREDGVVRSEYSFTNFAALNASDVRFGQDFMILTSTVDVQKGGNATRANLIITIEKMSVIKIEFGSDSSRPLGTIYGVVDSLVLVRDGERSVMPH